jgi:hypothetical protein
MTFDLAGQNRRHSDGGNCLAVIRTDKGKAPIMRSLLADAGSGAGMPAGAESLLIDQFDDGIMRCVLGQVDKVVLWQEIVLGHG